MDSFKGILTIVEQELKLVIKDNFLIIKCHLTSFYLKKNPNPPHRMSSDIPGVGGLKSQNIRSKSVS